MAGEEVAIETAAQFSVIEVFTDPVAEVQVTSEGPQGIPGEQGPPGIPSLGASTEYVFSTPLYVWEGVHPYLGKPTVIILDEMGEQMTGGVSYPQSRYDPDDSNLGLVVVTFATPLSGTLVIRA